MRTIMTIVSVWLMAGVVALAEGVRLGMTRSQVESLLGRPSAAMELGDRTILMYPEQGRVELIGGRVVEAAWVPIDSALESPLPTAKLPAPTLPPPSEGAPGANGSPDVTPPEDPATAKHDDGPEEMRRPSESAAAELAGDESVQSPDADREPSAPAERFWGELAIGALAQLAITVIALKAAFKWAEVHADWPQMIVPALADTITRSSVAAGAYLLWQAEQLFYVDEGIAYFALLFALLKTTHACTLQRAVTISVAAKVASVVVWSLLVLVASQWISS